MFSMSMQMYDSFKETLLNGISRRGFLGHMTTLLTVVKINDRLAGKQTQELVREGDKFVAKDIPAETPIEHVWTMPMEFHAGSEGWITLNGKEYYAKAGDVVHVTFGLGFKFVV